MRKEPFSYNTKEGTETKDAFREALLRRHRQNVTQRQARVAPPESEKYAKRFGNYIRTARVHAGLSYDALSRKTGIDKGKLRALEVGLFERDDVEAACIKKLAAALQQPTARLFLLLGQKEPCEKEIGPFCLLTQSAKITIEPQQAAPESTDATRRAQVAEIILPGKAVIFVSGNAHVHITLPHPQQGAADRSATYLGFGWKHTRDKFRPEREIREPGRQFMDK